jgi:ferredoxin/flavodoxin---NADP+ reductase
MPDTAPQADSSTLGTQARPLRVAVIGSGPSGFYAADALLKSKTAVHVAIFERFPTPYGLVRFGVAPDHSKIRNVIKVYEKTAAHGEFSFWGNVTVGRDVTIAELRCYFDAVIFAFGSETDRRLGIPGEDLPRSYTATAFCAWYNGHPDYRECHFDLSRPVAVVIGQGNVAMDVSRILSKSARELRETDMASHAVQALSHSQVRDIYVIGRRGPAQAAFTPKEIGEMGEIEGCDVFINPRDLQLNEASLKELESPDASANQRNMQVLRDLAARKPTGAPRRLFIRFFQSPVEIRGEGGVEAIVLETNELFGEPGNQKARGTGRTEVLPCDIVFRSIGYRGVPLPGAQIPFDEKRCVIPNNRGRVEPGLYAVGWIKRGPSGLIGTNKKDSEESVERLLEDVPRLPGAAEPDNRALRQLLAGRGVRVVTFADWRRIDEAEVQRGQLLGKPRDNFTSIAEMLATLNGQPVQP